MIYRVVVSLEAERDLEDIFRLIASERADVARRFVDGLRRRLRTLATTPKRCPRALEDGLAGMEIRHLIHGRYRILFGIEGSTVIVLQVRHGARKPWSGASKRG